MGYNRINKLLIIREITAVYNCEIQNEGSVIAVYRKHIEPKYHISLRTLYNYLSIPVHRHLKESGIK